MAASSRESVVALLGAHADEWRRYGVLEMHLFGSVARGDYDEHSDVDVMVDLKSPATYSQLFHLKERLEALLGRRVDLVTRNGARRRPRLIRQIEKDARRVA
ncbi:MAG: nucleotidyltransferase family protein [Myxococcales bacterium]|nr:nucleotidyltransferase family protein [Myxococcales bacterium]